MAGALEAVHPVLHRDVKPSNVLVRAFRPLDLVLSDFGLARSTEHSHIVSTVAGSIAYQSPEALDGGASAARDWWAVGMIIAEAAIGRHPFHDLELGWPSTLEMRIALTTRPVPLDEIHDPRIRLLCRGLLTRDPRHRWGAGEIHAWTAGGSPPVVDDAGAAKAHDTAAIQPFVFAGQRCTSPEQLAPLFAQHWNDALRLVSGQASEAPDYVRLILWLQEHENRAALRVLEQGAQDRSFARRLFRLLRVLRPELPPTFRGEVIDLDGLLVLAARAAGGDADASTVVYDLQQLGIIGELAREDEHADMITLDQRWTAQVELLNRLRDQLGAIGTPLADGDVERAARARILTALLDPTALETLAQTVGSSDQPALAENDQLRTVFEQTLGDRDEPARLIAALLVQDAARDELPRIRAARQAAEERVRIEREAGEQAAREQREREYTQRAQAQRMARAAMLSDLVSSFLTSVRIIGGIGLLSSLIATIWSSTTFEVADGGSEYGQGLRLLLGVTALTALPALGASFGFDILAARGRWQGRALSQIPSWHRFALVAAAVGPPLLVFVSHWGEPFSDWGGGDHGPPVWFWLIGPATLATVHIGCLINRATRSIDARRAYLVIGLAAAAGLLAGWALREATFLRNSSIELPLLGMAPDETSSSARGTSR